MGNYWVYAQWHVDSTRIDTVREEVLNVQNIISDNTKIRAYGTYRFNYKNEPPEDALISLKANGSNGLYYLGFRIPTDSLYNFDKGLYFKYPAKVGDMWEHTDVLYYPQNGEMVLGDTQTITLVDTTKTVETSAGIFKNCYVYTHWGFNNGDYLSTEKHYFYVKPRIGIIGVDTYIADDKDELYGQWRLLEYKLN